MSLSCQANGNVDYSWEKFNDSLPDNINDSYTSMLNFTFLSPNDAGKYRCRVTDNNGYYGYSNYAVLKINGQCIIISTHIHIYVYVCTYIYDTIYNYIVPAPQIIKQPTDTTAAKPFGAHFTCTANGYGNIRILWSTKNQNGTLPAKATVTEERSLESVTSTLFIPNVVLADEGGYYCTAWIGLVSTSSLTAYLQEISMKCTIL